MVPKIRPTLQLLNAEQINAIHEYSLKILENTGIRVESKNAQKIFGKSKHTRLDGETVYINRELVNQSINLAPENVEIFTKSGELAFHLGNKQGKETHFGIGVTNTYFQDIETNRVVPFKRNHMQVSSALGNALEHIDMISTIGIPSNVEVQKLDLFGALDLYSNSIKPMVLLITESSNIDRVFDLLEHLHGDIKSKPFCIPYVNPITPLVLNKATSDKMEATIGRGLPLMYSNYVMYGGSSPITEGGSLALINAELLAGLVFSQLIKEETPIILGSLPAAFNMQTMGSQYTSTTYLLNLACAEMMHNYKIPHCGTSGSNNGWGPDILASADLWQNHLSSCLGKIGCAPFIGGNFDSLAFSPSTVVLSNSIIGQTKKFCSGFSINEDLVNLDEIHKVGHGGNYFTSPQTLSTISEFKEKSNIWPAFNIDSWLGSDPPNAEKHLKEFTLSMYKEAESVAQDNIDEVMRGEEYIAKKF